MARYVKFRQACNCDADPMPSTRTTRAVGSQERREEKGYTGLQVLYHPVVCPVCHTPYAELPVMQEVD